MTNTLKPRLSLPIHYVLLKRKETVIYLWNAFALSPDFLTSVTITTESGVLIVHKYKLLTYKWFVVKRSY